MLCYICTHYANGIAIYLEIPDRWIWQLQIGLRAKRVGHWTVHYELEDVYHAIEYNITPLREFEVLTA